MKRIVPASAAAAGYSDYRFNVALILEIAIQQSVDKGGSLKLEVGNWKEGRWRFLDLSGV
jgi:hypothetical protein